LIVILPKRGSQLFLKRYIVVKSKAINYNRPMGRELLAEIRRQNETDYQKLVGSVMSVDLKVPTEDVTNLFELMNISPIEIGELPDIKVPTESLDWLSDPRRRRLQVVFAATMAHLTKPIATVARNYIEKKDGPPARFSLEVGFFGEETGVSKIAIRKIRTMNLGAEGELKTPWEESSFKGGDLPFSEDSRILEGKLVPIIRKMSLDEVDQLWQIVKTREMDLVGLRAYTMKEVKGNVFLHDFRDDPNLGLSPEAKIILEIYPSVIDKYQPRPSVMTTLNAYMSKDTRHMIRMLGDILYLLQASPRVDWMIFLNSFSKRARGVGNR